MHSEGHGGRAYGPSRCNIMLVANNVLKEHQNLVGMGKLSRHVPSTFQLEPTIRETKSATLQVQKRTCENYV